MLKHESVAKACSVIIIPLISCYSPPIQSPSPNTLAQTVQKHSRSKNPDLITYCAVFIIAEKTKRTRSHFKTSVLAFLSHISLAKKKKHQKSVRKQAACSFYGDLKLDHSATMAGSDRAVKGHHLLYLSSAWSVCALTKVNDFVNVCQGVIENQREYTVLLTVYELCLPCMMSCIACLL